MALTDTKLQRLPARERPYQCADGGGLYVEVQPTGQTLGFNNSNGLVKSGTWDIQLQKTGYIREAGKCLVMQAWLNNKPVVIVLLDSWGRLTRIGDANRIKRWIENASTNSTRPSAALVRRTAG